MESPDADGPRRRERGPRGRDNESQSSSYGRTARRAYAAVYPPAGRRTLVAYAYRCPHCDGTHLGRAADAAAVAGVRRGGCGRLVDLVAGDAL